MRTAIGIAPDPRDGCGLFLTAQSVCEYRHHWGSTVRYRILGLLRHSEPVHGYALWKAFEGRFGQRIQNGKFYRVLKTMAESGWIRALARSMSDPRRTLYEITPLGTAEFDSWLAALDNLDPGGDDALAARVGFFFELEPAIGLEFFAGIENLLSARWKRFEHERECELARRSGSVREQVTRVLFLTRSLENAATDLNWVREARAVYDRLHAELVAAAPSVPRRRGAVRAKR